MKPTNPYPAMRSKQKALFEAREKDWRNGGIVYQIFVDRFAPSANLAKKKHLYAAPRTLQNWTTLPQRGVKDPHTRYWTHELAFWGGDLPSLIAKLDYLTSLGINTVYLNPIFEAFSNHKYDTYHYDKISPEYGTMDDLQTLINKLSKANMHLILDGVFNHMAIESPAFTKAKNATKADEKDWFVFGREFPTGFRLWHNVSSLPELNLKNPVVRDYLFNGPDSIVKRYLKMGLSGWRLDTAIELGYDYLYELTAAAHEVNPQSVVIGELNNYPQGWAPAMDGTMLLPLRDLIMQMIKGFISARVFSESVQQMITETGLDTFLKSWLLLENHDTGRIASDLPDFNEYLLAKTLQFTLPGTINLYMGEEIGTQGGDDPFNRATMDWSVVEKGNTYSTLHRQLITIRQQHRALKIGDIKFLSSEKLIAYLRTTDKVDDSIVVIINPHSYAVQETILVSEPQLKSHLRFINLITGKVEVTSYGILLPISIPAKTSWILKPDLSPVHGYSAYKNIKVEN